LSATAKYGVRRMVSKRPCRRELTMSLQAFPHTLELA
jgi:hypothetical protein